MGSIPGLGRSLGEGNGYPLQYSCLENSMDRGAWRATVHGVTKVGHSLATFTFSTLVKTHILFFTCSFCETISRLHRSEVCAAFLTTQL